MKEIQLTQGRFVMVDDADYEWLNQYKWYYSNAGRTGYACSKMGGVRLGSNGKIFHMHRIVAGDDCNGFIVDHIDGNGLNNQRNNLRVCTHEENMQNRDGRLALRVTHRSIRFWKFETIFRHYK